MQKHLAQHWQAFMLAKRGHRPDEYEDACAGDPESGRFAVADGASESSFASIWARLLVKGFVHANAQKTPGNTWLDPLRARWAKEVDGQALAWYGEEKRDQGADATFLGLAILPGKEGNSGRWKCLAVGDSCLFQVRQDRLIAAFPLSRAADFNNRPALLNSRSARAGTAAARQKVEWGKWQPGDRFFLMTDAFAQWFLTRHAGARKPWQSLTKRLAEAAEQPLAAYVEQLRDRKEIKNDDVTLVVIGPLE